MKTLNDNNLVVIRTPTGSFSQLYITKMFENKAFGRECNVEILRFPSETKETPKDTFDGYQKNILDIFCDTVK